MSQSTMVSLEEEAKSEDAIWTECHADKTSLGME